MTATLARELYGFDVGSLGRDSLNLAVLLFQVADWNNQHCNRLIDRYSRLIWGITVIFKLAESDTAGLAQKRAAPTWGCRDFTRHNANYVSSTGWLGDE